MADNLITCGRGHAYAGGRCPTCDVLDAMEASRRNAESAAHAAESDRRHREFFQGIHERALARVAADPDGEARYEREMEEQEQRWRDEAATMKTGALLRQGVTYDEAVGQLVRIDMFTPPPSAWDIVDLWTKLRECASPETYRRLAAQNRRRRYPNTTTGRLRCWLDHVLRRDTRRWPLWLDEVAPTEAPMNRTKLIAIVVGVIVATMATWLVVGRRGPACARYLEHDNCPGAQVCFCDDAKAEPRSFASLCIDSDDQPNGRCVSRNEARTRLDERAGRRPGDEPKPLLDETTTAGPPRSTFRLGTNPPRAAILVDGKLWPHLTPTDVTAPIGQQVHIEMKLDGYETRALDMKFQETNPPITITLDAQKPPVGESNASPSSRAAAAPAAVLPSRDDLPLGKWGLDDLKIGITTQGPDGPKVMMLDPTGIGTQLKVGDHFSREDAKVAQIDAERVAVTVELHVDGKRTKRVISGR